MKRSSSGTTKTGARRQLTAAATLALLVTVVLRGAGPDTSRISKDLLSADANGLAEVIVQFGRAPGDSDIGDIVGNGGVLRRTYRNIPAAAFRIPLHALNGIAS